MRDAVIVSAVRTAVGKAPKGTLSTTRPDDLGAAVIAEAIKRAPGLDAAEVDDVILRCAMPEAEQGLNVARIASLRAGVPVTASAVTVNRFCSSGLQANAYAAERIMCGFGEVVVRRLVVALLSVAVFIAPGAGYAAAAGMLVEKVIEAYGAKGRLSTVSAISAEGRITAFVRGDEGTYRRTLRRDGSLLVDIVYSRSSERRILQNNKGYRGTGARSSR